MDARLYTSDGRFVADVVVPFHATVVIWGDRFFLESHREAQAMLVGPRPGNIVAYLETDAVAALTKKG